MKPLLDADQVAAIVLKPTSWVLDKRAFDCPRVKVGGSVRFREDDVATWIEANTEAPLSLTLRPSRSERGVA